MSSIPVPFLDLSRAMAPLRSDMDAAMARVLDSMRFVLADEGAALEAECARRLQVAGAVGVASGTDALILSYRALGLQPGDEVITSPFSFFASAGAIVQAGATPRFADIEPDGFNLDPQAVAAAVGPRTAALCPVHLFGQTAAMSVLMAEAGKRSLKVVEDAAQAIGAAHQDRPAGSLGHLAAFSFYPTKNLGGLGDGGLVTSIDPALAERVRLLRHHGQTGPYHHDLVGTNSRLDELQAAVLRVKLNHLDAWTASRRALADGYRARFADTVVQVKVGGRMEGADIVLPRETAGSHHVYNLFTIRAQNRDGLMQHLQSRSVGCGIYYPLPLHLQPCFQGLGHPAGAFPEAEAASREVLSLPLYPGLSGAEQEVVVGAVEEFYREGGGVR